MIGQQNKSKFETPRQNASSMSIILKRTAAPKAHVNLILDMPMEESTTIQDSLITNASIFDVQESGYYHVSSQICLQNSSDQDIKTDFIQFGLVAWGSLLSLTSLLRAALQTSFFA